MIKGTVDSKDVPQIILTIAGRSWSAVIDTGFNGDLELSDSLRDALSPRSIGTIFSNLAAGQTIEEELYAVTIRFDDELIDVEATFVAGDITLIGTRLLRNHCLTINFPARAVRIERPAKI